MDASSPRASAMDPQAMQGSGHCAHPGGASCLLHIEMVQLGLGRAFPQLGSQNKRPARPEPQALTNGCHRLVLAFEAAQPSASSPAVQ